MINDNDIRYFKCAKAVSELSDFQKVHIGSIAVYRNAIISSGFNSNKGHVIQYKYNRFRFDGYDVGKLHSEIACLIRIKDMDLDWSKVKLYTYREFKNGKPALAHPCPSCMAMIKDLGIKNIYYTANYGYSHQTLVD